MIGVGLLSALCFDGCSPEVTRDDTGPAQARREHTIERLLAGDLAVEGPGYTVLSYDPLVAFFQTWTGLSPDPYCGYEYAADPSAVEPDPLGSGDGNIDQFKDAWYWLCAS